jgi:hypothetical protein
MESQKHQNRAQKQVPARPRVCGVALAACGMLFFAQSQLSGLGSQTSTNPLPNRPIVIPNRTLGPDEMRNLSDKSSRKHSFDAANAARKKLIDDETNKLLILARDLKAKTDQMGSDTPSPLMLREAAMIEVLANDVKEKMKLTISPD